MRLLIYQRRAPSQRSYGLMAVNSSLVFIEEADGGIHYPPYQQGKKLFEDIERFSDLVAITESWLETHPYRYELVFGKDQYWIPM